VLASGQGRKDGYQQPLLQDGTEFQMTRTRKTKRLIDGTTETRVTEKFLEDCEEFEGM